MKQLSMVKTGHLVQFNMETKNFDSQLTQPLICGFAAIVSLMVSVLSGRVMMQHPDESPVGGLAFLSMGIFGLLALFMFVGFMTHFSSQLVNYISAKIVHRSLYKRYKPFLSDQFTSLPINEQCYILNKYAEHDNKQIQSGSYRYLESIKSQSLAQLEYMEKAEREIQHCLKGEAK